MGKREGGDEKAKAKRKRKRKMSDCERRMLLEEEVGIYIIKSPEKEQAILDKIAREADEDWEELLRGGGLT